MNRRLATRGALASGLIVATACSFTAQDHPTTRSPSERRYSTRGITPTARRFLPPDIAERVDLVRYIYLILLSRPSVDSRERAAVEAYLRCFSETTPPAAQHAEVFLPVTRMPGPRGAREFSVYADEVVTLVDLDRTAAMYQAIVPPAKRRTSGVVILDLKRPIANAIQGEAVVLDLSSVPGPRMADHFEQLRRYLAGADPTYRPFALWAKDQLFYTDQTLQFMGRALRVFEGAAHAQPTSEPLASNACTLSRAD